MTLVSFIRLSHYDHQQTLLVDLEMLVQHLKFMKSVAQAEPLKSMIASEEDPKAKCTTDEEIRGSFICIDCSLL